MPVFLLPLSLLPPASFDGHSPRGGTGGVKLGRPLSSAAAPGGVKLGGPSGRKQPASRG
uniref:Uncharacterized protein n=1 Tax=Arundo donax TaxID=35708 RepID=A0A0A9C6F7_ARUDO